MTPCRRPRRRDGRRCSIGLPVVLTLALVLATPSATRAWQLGAGGTAADVGLHENGNGFFVGVAGRTDLSDSPVGLVYGLDYVQKVGAQPTLFTDPITGFVTDDATVTLHCLQPTLLVDYRLGQSSRLPRPYLGLSLALKLSEDWSDFPGTPSVAFAYKDIDFAFHTGLRQPLGRWALDLRASWGLSRQLLEDTSGTSARKAGETVPGAQAPEIGARLQHYQLGLWFAF